MRFQRRFGVSLTLREATSISLDRVFHMPIAQVVNKLARDTRCSGLEAESQSLRRLHRFFVDSLQ